LVQAREALADERLAAARSLGEAARARAEKARAVGSILEARLVLGEAEVREKRGTDWAKALAHEARAKGFLLIAVRAEKWTSDTSRSQPSRRSL
jgi:hypothetical protein